jgi:hypothetical protein
MSFGGHGLWLALVVACLAWYSTVTIYVAIKGASDIRRMLARLEELERDRPS